MNIIVDGKNFKTSPVNEIAFTKLNQEVGKMSTAEETASTIISMTTSAANATECLNLKEILQLFKCGISQEQAWAVLYQTLSKLKYLLDNDLQLVKLNADLFDVNLLNFTKDGALLFDFKHFYASNSSSSSNGHNLINSHDERTAIESKVFQSYPFFCYCCGCCNVYLR